MEAVELPGEFSRRGGILARCQAEGSCPLVLHTDTEAFRGRSGLVTSPDGR